MASYYPASFDSWRIARASGTGAHILSQHNLGCYSIAAQYIVVHAGQSIFLFSPAYRLQ